MDLASARDRSPVSVAAKRPRRDSRRPSVARRSPRRARLGNDRVVDSLVQSDPVEGAQPTGRPPSGYSRRRPSTHLRCHPQRSSIVSYSVRRDAGLASEDHVRLCSVPFRDGRSGYVFAVNPIGARYDGLINPGGESENAEWDGIWTRRRRGSATGSTAEIWIPIQTLAFKTGLPSGTSTSSGGSSVPRDGSLGLAGAAVSDHADQPRRAPHGPPSVRPRPGLTIAPRQPGDSVCRHRTPTWMAVPAQSRPVQAPGLERPASATFNTDFAETEVDTRRTTTRFPSSLPSNAPSFSKHHHRVCLGRAKMAHYEPPDRLIDGVEVPIIAGAKINGRSDRRIRWLATLTNDRHGVVTTSRPWQWRASAERRPRVMLAHRHCWRSARTFRRLLAGRLHLATSRFRGTKTFSSGELATAEDLAAVHRRRFNIDYPNDKGRGPDLLTDRP